MTFDIICSNTIKNRIKEKLKESKEISEIYRIYKTPFSEEELHDLILSACLSKDIRVNVIKRRRYEVEIDIEEIKNWIEKKLIPNTVILTFEDNDVIELLLFSIEFAFSIFEGKTKATITQKGFRERSRELETIIINTFTGLIGEVGVKRLLENRFNIEIKLDRSISTEIDKYRSDILNAKKLVSIKTTPNLLSIWAECPIGYDYGIFVKAIVPPAILLRAFAHVCGFRSLINYSKEKISSSEILTIVSNLENRLIHTNCGNLETRIKTFVCGYFQPTDGELITSGTELCYIGEIREDRYFIPISKLKYSHEDWDIFVKDVFSDNNHTQ